MTVRNYTFTLTETPVALNLGTFDKHSRSVNTIIFNSDKDNNNVALIGGSTLSLSDFGVHLDPDESFTISSAYNADDGPFYARAKAVSAILHVLVVD